MGTSQSPPPPPAKGSGGAVLDIRGVTKRFGDFVACDAIDFDLRPGEVHALLGENGAGKSTLMNVLYGLYAPDEGEIFVKGDKIALGSPADAIAYGIGMVHQHFMLVPVMTVAENIVLALEPKRAGILFDQSAAEDHVREISERFGLAVDPEAVIHDISVGQQQRVEILKALYRGADILILDEPTAVLTPQETKELEEILRSLTAQGTSIIFITHKLHEVLEIADRITVLRRGEKVATIPRSEATEAGLAKMMVGREVLLTVEKGPAQPGETLLSVENLSVRDDRDIEAVRGVSFEVRAGEIVGIAGVDGNGQSELIDAIAGLRRAATGRIVVAGEDVTKASPHGVLEAGLSHIPTDRQHRGLVLAFSLAENIALHDFDKPPASNHGWLYPGRLRDRARTLIEEFDVRGGGPDTAASSLSGGNQQKVIIAREISRDPRVLVAAQPTRGVDIGAIEFVHKRLVAERDEGRAILLISFEFDEILSLSDRILVMRNGKFVADFLPGVTAEELGMAMLGAPA
jgi:general nucleoside transport system ATP-binding protein